MSIKMSNFFSVLIKSLSIEVAGIQIKSIIIFVYLILCWTGTLIYKLKHPKKTDYPFVKNSWLSVLFAPFLVIFLPVYFSVLLIVLNSIKTIIQFYKNTFAVLFFVIIQFWQIIPNTPISMKSRVMGDAEIYWSHKSQMILLSIFLSFLLIKFFWKYFPKKDILKKHKYLNLGIVVVVVINGTALCDMLLSQATVNFKTFFLSLAAIIVGGFVDQIRRGERLKLNPFSYL
ncbi:hypothetical protein D4R86_02610 [bacterium]|nr:MAG: hypothetical protein D4R86_02610 [bacterium]